MKEEALHNYERLHYHHEDAASSDRLLYNISGKSPEIDPDVSAAWGKVSTKISKPSKASFFTSSWIKLAASIVLVGLIGIYFLTQSGQPENYVTLKSGESVKTFELPDGSYVTINQNSTLSYFENFTGKRNVLLTGEAYFEVKKSHIPFNILSDDGKITVLGTTFNVKNGRTNLRVLVTSGKVRLSGKKKSIVLEKGQEGWINKNNQNIYTEPEADINKIAWKTRTFKFDNHQLAQALEILEEHYKVEIELKNEELQKCTITGTFNDLPLRDILESFAAVLDLNIKYRKDYILIKGKGC